MPLAAWHKTAAKRGNGVYKIVNAAAKIENVSNYPILSLLNLN